MSTPAICAAPNCPNLRPCPAHPVRDLPRNWPALSRIVRDRDGHRCVMCGTPCPHPRHHHVDHIVPRVEGGSDAKSNLRTVCERFNLTGSCQ